MVIIHWWFNSIVSPLDSLTMKIIPWKSTPFSIVVAQDLTSPVAFEFPKGTVVGQVAATRCVFVQGLWRMQIYRPTRRRCQGLDQHWAMDGSNDGWNDQLTNHYNGMNSNHIHHDDSNDGEWLMFLLINDDQMDQIIWLNNIDNINSGQIVVNYWWSMMLW